MKTLRAALPPLIPFVVITAALVSDLARATPSRALHSEIDVRDVVTEQEALLGAWVGFGLFTILCSAAVALHADRLAHRQRQAVLTDYFEHIMQLPLTFHSGTHSGRLMKVMLTGVDALWGLWLSFFREHFAAFVALFVLLPLSLLINWRLASLLVALCVVFTGLTALVIRKTEKLQSKVEGHYTALAERASDALSNVALVQGFSRVEAEVTSLRSDEAGNSVLLT